MEEFILTYVPEAEDLSCWDAYMLALERDWDAAENLYWSIVEEVVNV